MPRLYGCSRKSITLTCDSEAVAKLACVDEVTAGLDEQMGLIVPIGRHVLHQALSAVPRRRRDRGWDLAISVNLSPCQFRDPNLVDTVRQELLEADVKALSLILEITEGVLMSGHIDRTFITDRSEDCADRELVNAAIQMAYALGLTVVAEGVETEQQLAALAERGCDNAQGYLFSKPMSETAVTQVLASPLQVPKAHTA